MKELNQSKESLTQPEAFAIYTFNPMKKFYKSQKENPQQKLIKNGRKSVVSDATSVDTSIDLNQNEAKKVQLKQKLVLNAAYTTYAIVRQVCKRDLKMKVTEDAENENFDLIWSDHALPIDRLIKLK